MCWAGLWVQNKNRDTMFLFSGLHPARNLAKYENERQKNIKLGDIIQIQHDYGGVGSNASSSLARVPKLHTLMHIE